MADPRQLLPECPKGARLRLRYGATTYYAGRGFRTKRDASNWIDSLPGLNWRVGFTFAMRDIAGEFEIVTNKGALP